MYQVKLLPGTETREFNTKRGPMQVTSVKGLVKMGHETRQVELELKKGQQAPAPGDYTLTLSHVINQYGRFEIGREWTLGAAAQKAA